MSNSSRMPKVEDNEDYNITSPYKDWIRAILLYRSEMDWVKLHYMVDHGIYALGGLTLTQDKSDCIRDLQDLYNISIWAISEYYDPEIKKHLAYTTYREEKEYKKASLQTEFQIYIDNRIISILMSSFAQGPLRGLTVTYQCELSFNLDDIYDRAYQFVISTLKAEKLFDVIRNIEKTLDSLEEETAKK